MRLCGILLLGIFLLLWTWFDFVGLEVVSSWTLPFVGHAFCMSIFLNVFSFSYSRN